MSESERPTAEREPDAVATFMEKDRKRARIARLVALGGALAVVLVGKSLITPHLPSDHSVEMRLDTPEEVVGLDVRWSAPGSEEDISTTSFRFPAGQAPASVRTNVRLPDGAYDVAIAVERASGVDSTRRRIELSDASLITIPLR
ncbi:MAG: hypothetical protein R3B70_40535 [Polyangiaceae bacterium]